MAFAIEGFSAVAQNWISRGVASNFYQKAPFLAVLGALTLGNQKKTSLEIGRPGSGEILSGGNISPIERKKLGTINAYIPRVQKFTTSNSAYRGARNALPDVSNKTTNSHGQATDFGAKFHWCHLDTPILIWHEDKNRAAQEGTKEGQAITMGQKIDEATEVAHQEHIDKLAGDVWNGNPSHQGMDPWDNPLGIIQALDTANIYANVDRTVETTWQSQKDSNLTAPDVRKIIDDANLTKGLRVKGNGANLLLCNINQYQIFKAQVLTQSGGVVLQNGLPAMAKMGMTKELLQLDNVIIMYDPSCPNNTVCCFDTTVWKFMVHPLFNFKVTEFIDNTKTGLAKQTYDYAYISTRYMLTCDNPFLNVRYTAIGT